MFRSVTSRALVTATALALTLTAAGCGSTTKSTTAKKTSSQPSSGASAGGGSASSGGGSTSAATAQLNSYTAPINNYQAIQPISGVASLKGKTVWYVPIGEAVPVLAAIGSAMQSALSAAGIRMHTCDGQLLPTTIASCLNQAASQGASGVVTDSVDYALVPTAYKNLEAHHIPVMLAGEDPDGGITTSTPKLAFYGIDTTTDLIQRLLIDAVVVKSNGKANMLYVGANDSPETLNNFTYGQKTVTQLCPKCSMKTLTYNTADLGKLPSQVTASLLSNSNTNYVAMELDAAGPSAVSGIQSAGFRNKVKLASADGNLDALQRVKAGTLQFTDVGISASYTGWQTADGIIRVLLGHLPVIIPGVVRVFTTSNVSGLTLTPAAYDTNAWYGSNAYMQTFLKAWGVK